MNDRELLEAAAKAAGMVGEYGGLHDLEEWWNPLADDADAFRLGVKLNLFDYNLAFTCELAVQMRACADPYDATRRAIVRAAAKLASSDNLPNIA